jgi:hypothetical protein
MYVLQLLPNYDNLKISHDLISHDPIIILSSASWQSIRPPKSTEVSYIW